MRYAQFSSWSFSKIWRTFNCGPEWPDSSFFREIYILNSLNYYKWMNTNYLHMLLLCLFLLLCIIISFIFLERVDDEIINGTGWEQLSRIGPEPTEDMFERSARPASHRRTRTERKCIGMSIKKYMACSTTYNITLRSPKRVSISFCCNISAPFLLVKQLVKQNCLIRWLTYICDK